MSPSMNSTSSSANGWTLINAHAHLFFYISMQHVLFVMDIRLICKSGYCVCLFSRVGRMSRDLSLLSRGEFISQFRWVWFLTVGFVFDLFSSSCYYTAVEFCNFFSFVSPLVVISGIHNLGFSSLWWIGEIQVRVLLTVSMLRGCVLNCFSPLWLWGVNYLAFLLIIRMLLIEEFSVLTRTFCIDMNIWGSLLSLYM